MDFEHIIGVYTRKYKQARAANDPRAEDFGRRLTMWIQTAEQNSDLYEDRGSAFNNGRMNLGSNVLVLS